MALAVPSRRIAATAALLLLLLLATEMGAPTTKMAEARTCASQSHNFHGACISSSNCANVCSTEGFPAGDCKTRGLLRKCYCEKPC